MPGRVWQRWPVLPIWLFSIFRLQSARQCGGLEVRGHMVGGEARCEQMAERSGAGPTGHLPHSEGSRAAVCAAARRADLLLLQLQRPEPGALGAHHGEGRGAGLPAANLGAEPRPGAGGGGKFEGRVRRSEVFSKFALEIQQPGKKGIRYSQRQVAACGRVKDRFQFVLHLMDFALEIKQEMDTQKSSRWTEMQQKLQGFLACPRVQGKVSKDSWQALAALEDDLMDTLKNTIDQHLQSSKEHEQSLEEKQQQQFEKDTLAKMDQDRQVIWSLLHEGELKEKHKAGLQKCLGRIRSMYELMQKVEPTRPCLEAWDAARAAVQSYGEMPVRWLLQNLDLDRPQNDQFLSGSPKSQNTQTLGGSQPSPWPFLSFLGLSGGFHFTRKKTHLQLRKRAQLQTPSQVHQSLPVAAEEAAGAPGVSAGLRRASGAPAPAGRRRFRPAGPAPECFFVFFVFGGGKGRNETRTHQQGLFLRWVWFPWGPCLG